MPSLPAFDVLWRGFPSGDPADVKRLIGGKVDAPWITNTCAIRVSRALNSAGALHRLPRPGAFATLNVVSGKDGLWYAYRVSELAAYLSATYGKPVRFEGGGADLFKPTAKVRGIIQFHVEGWSDATGHMDLWNGLSCRHACYFAPVAPARTRAFDVWKCP